MGRMNARSPTDTNHARLLAGELQHRERHLHPASGPLYTEEVPGFLYSDDSITCIPSLHGLELGLRIDPVLFRDSIRRLFSHEVARAH